MRYRVKVERATNTRDAGGGLSQVFNSVATIYANIKPKSANSNKCAYNHTSNEKLSS